MTWLRKKLQDKLRRKYKYNTFTDIVQGTTLFKQNANVVQYISAKTSDKYNVVTNLEVRLNRRAFITGDGKNAIAVELTQFSNAFNTEKYKELSSATAVISYEELELMYKIASEMKKEVEEDI